MAGGLSQGSLLEALVVLAVIGATLAAFAISERSRRRALQALRGANEALRAQTEIARSIVDSKTEWITRYDADLRITFVNGSFASLEGRRPEDFIGRSMADLKDAEGLARMRAQLATLTPERPSATFDVPGACRTAPERIGAGPIWRSSTSRPGPRIPLCAAGT